MHAHMQGVARVEQSRDSARQRGPISSIDELIVAVFQAFENPSNALPRHKVTKSHPSPPCSITRGMLMRLSREGAAIAQEDQHDERKTGQALLRSPTNPDVQGWWHDASRCASSPGSSSLSSASATSPATPSGLPIQTPEPLVFCGSLAKDADDQGPNFAKSIEMLKTDAEAQEPVVSFFCRVLDRTVVDNDGRSLAHNSPVAHPLFQHSRPCPLCPSEYVQRILKYTRCSPCNLIVGLIYLQRLKDLDTDGKCTRLTSYNIQRLLLTAIMLASKFLDEPHVSNKQWALVGDLSVQEMNSLELEMLWLLKFSLNTSRDEYDECLRSLETINRELFLTDTQ
jgi:hypothetical protein